jgi:exonuclease III
MRVISLNAWCGTLLEPLLDWLPRCGADVLCVQEVTWSAEYDGWVVYSDPDRTIRQRSSLFDDLRQALPGYQAQFYCCDTGPVQDENGGVHRQYFGIATLIRPHLSVIGAEAAFVHGAFAHHDAWPGEDRGRIAHAVRVADTDGRVVTVGQLHGVRMAAGKGDSPERARQAERLVELLDRVRRPGDITVVAGDLNLLPESETHRILGRAGLTDLVGWADTRTSAYPKPLRHADYLFVSDPSAVATFEVLAEPEVSDHRPLVLDLRSGRS